MPQQDDIHKYSYIILPVANCFLRHYTGHPQPKYVQIGLIYRIYHVSYYTNKTTNQNFTCIPCWWAPSLTICGNIVKLGVHQQGIQVKFWLVVLQQCYSITKLIYFLSLGGFYTDWWSTALSTSEKLHGPLGPCIPWCARVCIWMRATGVGHMMRHDAWCGHDETSVVGPGLGGLRDGSRTEGWISHNSIPPSRPCLEAWEGWSMPVPQHLASKIKGGTGEG